MRKRVLAGLIVSETPRYDWLGPANIVDHDNCDLAARYGVVLELALD